MKPSKPNKKDIKARVARMRERVKKMMENPREVELRRMMVEDLKFVNEPGSQWDDYTKKERGKKRPYYEFNRLRVTVKRVINSMRANRPQGKVRAVEDGDKDTAEVIEGQIRNICSQSDFESITDNAAEYQVAGGYAAWRVMTRYVDESVFEQDAVIEAIRNPLCLWCDPDAFDLTGADAKDWFFTDRMSKDAFKARWPNAEPCSFDDDEFDNSDWNDDELVRVGEYWWKEQIKVTVHLLSDGKTIEDSELEEAIGRGLQIMKSRETTKHKIYSAIYSADAELEPPTEFPGPNFPWIRTYGDYLIIDGKTYWSGLARHSKDAQRAFNLGLTSAYEQVARASIAQVWATPTQAEGLEARWSDADKKNYPFQLYNHDPQAPGPPSRIAGPDVPVAHIQMAQLGAEEIKANSGIFDASLGRQSTETSGVAIRARTEQGEIATFNYPDNMAKAVARTWKILIGIIPYVYDTTRSIRILGQDGAEKYVKVNEPDAQGNVLNDLSRGRYDLVVTVGPSYATKRMEAVESYSQMTQSNPQLLQIAGDIIMKNMDLPGADQIGERIKLMLPPQIAQTLQENAPPPEVQQAMAQVDQAMQQVQQQGLLVQQAAEEAKQEQAGADKAKAELQLQMASLKTEEANLLAKQSQFKALVAETQVKLIAENGQREAENESQERAVITAQIGEAFQQIQAQVEAFMLQSAQVMQAMQQAPPTVIVAPSPPKKKTIRVKRINGELVGEAMEEAEGMPPKKTVARVKRVNGELVGESLEVPNGET